MPDINATDFGFAPDEVSQVAPPQTTTPTPVSQTPSNNPLNLRPLPKGTWAGQTGIAGGFASFDTPQSGWNAADQNLLAKVNEHGAKSLGDIIGNPTYGWAPASDNNDPVGYAARVAKEVGIQPGDDISQRLLTDIPFRHSVLSSMAGVETGKPQVFGGAGALNGTAFGLTPDEVAQLSPSQQATLEKLQVPPAATMGGQQASSGKFFTSGAAHQPVTQAQEATLKDIAQNRGWNPRGVPGFDGPPFALEPGGVLPRTPGAHYVDLDGKEHVVSGGLPELAMGGLAGIGQVLTGDVQATAAKLGMGVPSGPEAAIAQTQGAPSPLQYYQAGREAAAGQERNYQVEQGGNLAAQTGRAVAQNALGIGAALLTPELRLPELGLEGIPKALGAIGERISTNALRGVAAQTPSIGATPKPVATQLGEAAVAGAALPEVFNAGGQVGAGLRRLAVDPGSIPGETMDLAKKAIDTYQIPLRASQIGGTVDRNIGIRDSNLISGPFAKNNAQQISVWNQRLTSEAGAPGFRAPTPAAMSVARTSTGAIYDDLSSRYGINDASGLVDKLQGVYDDAKGAIPAQDLTPLAEQIERVKSVIQNGQITGAGYKGLTDTGTSLDRLAGSDGPLSAYAREFRDTIDSAFREGMTSADQARLDQANSQWRTMKAIEPLAAKAGPNGISPASLLPRLAANKYTKGALAYGQGDAVTDLARIGSWFMKEPPQSGTTPRLVDIAKRNALPTFLAATAGGEAALGHPVLSAFTNPQVAIQAATGLAAAKGVQAAGNALANYRLGPAAGRALTGLAGTPGSPVVAGLANVGKRVQVPLSALAGVRLGP